MNKTKYSSLKIAIGFALIVGIVYFGYQFIASRIIDGKKFAEIEPGKVTLLGIDAGAHYRIIVSNEIAQLVQRSSDKMETGDDAMGGDSDDSGDKRRVPLKETVQSLQGDTKALGQLVTIMNDDLRKDQDTISPTTRVWAADDLRKAISGDKQLKPKLEHDLNMHLDGRPLDYITVNALYNGITIDLPVPVHVSVHGVPSVLVAHVQLPYRPNFTKRVEDDIDNDKNSANLNPTEAQLKGYYLAEAAKVNNARNREDISANILNLISPDIVRTYADAAEHVLGNTRVVLNESFIKNASMEEETSETGKPMYDLELTLSEEGRERLWQYSRRYPHTQLLLIADGVAIAAPYVRHELAQSTVTITQMPDKDLVQDAIDDIKNSSGKVAAKP